MDTFMIGAIATASWVAGLFFLRFWWDTSDRLFLIFAIAFWLLALTRLAMVLINVLGFGMDLYDAIEAPRFRGFAPGEVLEAESRIPERVLDGLSRYGIRTEIRGTYHWGFGSVQAVMRDPATGELVGAADPRRSGYAEGY
jgi:gamma-glutamyltranspeptidase